METIQPGDGYTFSASSSGFNLNIDKPWTPSSDGGTGLMLGIGLPKFPDPPAPPDIPADLPGLGLTPLTEAKNPQQFQCRVFAMPISGTPTPVVQVAMGSVTYTHSVMPYIKTAPFTDHRQAYINFVAVKSSSVTPAPLVDATSPWMLGGGGYALTGTGRWYVTLSKWDAGNGAFEGGLLDQNLPWVSFVKDGSAEFDALFVDAGPSLYQNLTNIQKMEGYEEVVSEGETLMDWGHCHTTYFNPRFFGYHVRVLAIIDSVAATPFTAAITTLREGGPTAGNEVQLLTFAGQFNTGTATFSYGGATTTSNFNPSTQNGYDLQLCLETIPALSGNVFVQYAGPGLYQIEFTNVLRNTDVATITVNSSFSPFTTWYKVYQMHVGSQDVVIPCELNATFLMNKAGVTEAEDPYYINEATTPPWDNVVNNADAIAANALGFIPAWATPVINDTVPRAFTTHILNYAEEAGCTGDPSMDHPFKVIHVETDAGLSEYRIVSGTVNNVTPGNIASTISVSTGPYEVWVKAPYLAGVYPDATGYEWNIGTPVPADTDSEAYVRVASVDGASVTQYVTGSLWSDRIKMGTQTARYYHARI
jgi:hypothetical protein